MKGEIFMIEDSNTIFQINSKGWFLKGWSRAGLKTGFLLYPFKILFDCGINTTAKPEYVFLTHQHTDHTQALPNICSRHKQTISKVYVPSSSIKFITKYERVITELSDPNCENLTDQEILNHQNINLIPIDPFDIINLPKLCGDQELQIEVLKAYHDVQSNGYGVSSYVKKIKPEYEYLFTDLTSEPRTNMTKEDLALAKVNRINTIKNIKSSGIDMYNKVLMPEFAFFCDSTIHNLSHESAWKKYPVIICECTGLDADKATSDKKQNRDFDQNHTSILTLKPIMLDNKDKKWFIIHVSLGCSEDKIKQIESELNAEGINCTICV